MITTRNAPSPPPPPLTLGDAQGIAESIVGPVEWRGAEGWCTCPGIGLHTGANAKTDCKAVAEPIPLQGGTLAPGVYCFHASCLGACKDASFQIQSALGKRSPAGRPLAPARRPLPTRPDPVFDPAQLEQFARKLGVIDDDWLAARSRKRVDNRTAASFLHELYVPGEKVIVFDVFKSQGQHVWEHREPPFNACELDHFGRSRRVGVWFLSNPVSGAFVPKETEPEKETRRSWQTVTRFPYLVLESDEADPVHWLAALARTPLPVAAIYTSGGKSIHALVRIAAASKAEWDEKAANLKRFFITLGADRAAMSAVRLTRLPCCERLGTDDKNGHYLKFPEPHLQRLLYLNGTADDTPICELPIL